MTEHTRSTVFLSAMGALWYANLVALIVSMTDYPGSDALHDYKLMIGLVFLFLTGCFRQTYVMWRKDHKPDDI